MNCLTLGTQLVERINGPTYNSSKRALLYAKGKQENELRNECMFLVAQDPKVGSARVELQLTQDQVATWNDLLTQSGYFHGKSRLRGTKRSGRFDVAAYDPAGSLSHLMEVKFWSANDAVDQRWYSEESQPNHNILKSFEIDALKMQAGSAGVTQKWIVTAMFTIHCDGFAKDELKTRGFQYLSLLQKQNRDKAQIGNSDAYRDTGVQNLLMQLNGRFGTGTAWDAQFHHFSIFDRTTASHEGVGVSMDLIIAKL